MLAIMGIFFRDFLEGKTKTIPVGSFKTNTALEKGAANLSCMLHVFLFSRLI